MDYKAQIVSSCSSYNFVTRQLIATPQPEVDHDTPSRSKVENHQGQSIMSIVLFIAIFFGILTAFGVGLSSLSSNSNVSQRVSEYVRRLS